MKKLPVLFIVGGLLLAFLPASKAQITNGLVAYYPFEGNANDASGYNRDGTAYNGISYLPHLSGLAAHFSGASQYISLPASIPNDQDLTVTLWVRTSASTGNTFPWGLFLVSRDIAYANWDWNICIGQGRKIEFHTGTDYSDGFVLDTPNDIPSDEWVHVACVADSAGAAKSIYLNGQLAVSTNWVPHAFANNGVPIFLGNATAGTDLHPYFPGDMDEVRFYNRPLSSEEILAVYNNAACVPHRATALALISGGTVVGATITDGGCGYTNVPSVEIISGGGSGATAYAQVDSGTVTNLVITSAGSGYTNAPIIRIGAPLMILPSIISQPQDQTVTAGGTATFTVSAGGLLPLSYQWNYKGIPIDNATNTSLVLASVSLGQAGVYNVVITNEAGSLTSSNASLTVNPPTPCAPPPSGLVGWWQAEGDATDIIAGNNGALHGGVTFTGGEVNRAFSFDGSTGYIEVPDSPSLRMTNVVTIECWVAHQRLTTSYGDVIVEKGGDWTSSTLNYQVNVHAAYNNALMFMFAGGWRAGGSVAGTNWHHCAVVARNGDVDPILYIDGVQQPVTYRSGPGTMNMPTTTAPLHIGAQIDQGYYGKNLVDELSIYNRALSAAEIQAIYNAGSAGKCFAPTPPAIVTQPADQTAYLGLNATLNVVASGSPPLSYQWTFNGDTVAGGTSSSLVLTGVTSAQAGGYAVQVTNAYGSVTSATAQVTVSILAPYIIAQPQNRTVLRGANATFSVTASGSPPLSYQWNYQGAPIDSATNSSLLLTGVGLAQAGPYAVVITNAAGSVTSSVATLTVTLPPAAMRVVSTAGQGGRTVVVPVTLTANGNENALAFSLNFYPGLLTYAGASAGPGAPGAALLVNDSQAASGRVGFALGLSADSTFAPGTQQVVLVSFTAAILTSGTSTAVGFGDFPLARQVADVHGTLLPATYFMGSVTLSASDFEGDTSPRPNGNRILDISDWVLVGRYVARLDYPTNGSEFQRADCAPRATLGDGAITIIDWVQAGRYAAKLDPMTLAGGPTNETGGKLSVPKDNTPRQVRVADNLLLEGQTGTVSILLDAQGNENALGFSLAFDPALLTFQSATVGSSDSGAQFNVNSRQAAAGQLGFALALNSGSSFATGTCQIVKVSFRAASATAGNCTIALTDLPVPRQVSDPLASVLNAGYSNGTVSVMAPPSLNIERAAEAIALWWPGWATNFVLESAAGPNSAPTAWTNVPVNVVFTNNTQKVTLPASATEQYYRLRQTP